MALRHKSKRKPLFSLDTLTGEPDGRAAGGGGHSDGRSETAFCTSAWTKMNPDYREVLYLTYF